MNLYYAAENDNLECLKCAHDNDCPWNEKTCSYAARYGSSKCLTLSSFSLKKKKRKKLMKRKRLNSAALLRIFPQRE